MWQLQRRLTFRGVQSLALDVDEEELKRKVANRLHLRRAAGVDPLVIHIGPMDLTEEELEFYSWLALFSPRVALVEPNPAVLESLHSRLERRLKQGNATVVNQAVCSEDNKTVPFYRFSDQLFADYPDLRSTGQPFFGDVPAIYIHSSLDREAVLEGHRSAFVARSVLFGVGHSWAEWQDMESYIEEVPVQCTSPAALLRQLGVSPSGVDLLTIDAEGSELQILRSFLDMQGFAPTHIKFEWWAVARSGGNAVDAVAPFAAELVSRGFDLHQHGVDLVALRSAEV